MYSGRGEESEDFQICPEKFVVYYMDELPEACTVLGNRVEAAVGDPGVVAAIKVKYRQQCLYYRGSGCGNLTKLKECQP